MPTRNKIQSDTADAFSFPGFVTSCWYNNNKKFTTLNMTRCIMGLVLQPHESLIPVLHPIALNRMKGKQKPSKQGIVFWQSVTCPTNGQITLIIKIQRHKTPKYRMWLTDQHKLHERYETYTQTHFFIIFRLFFKKITIPNVRERDNTSIVDRLLCRVGSWR